MNSSQINAEQKAVNVMESIVAHDFSKVIKSYKKGVFVKVCGRREVLTMAHTVYRS